MKKFLIAFPVIFCLILSVCLPVIVSAESDPANGTYYPLEQFKSDNDYVNQDYQFYFYFTTFFPNSSYRFDSFYLQVTEDEISSLTELDGVYSVSFNETESLYRRVFNYGSFDDGHIFSVRSFVYDPVNNTLEFYSNPDFTSSVWIPGDWTVYNVDTNMLEPVSSLPDVVVKFKPNLSGEVDRVITDSDGTKSKLQDLQMNVANNSSFPIQYKMSIYKDYQERVTKRNYDDIFKSAGVDSDATTVPGAEQPTEASTVAPNVIISSKKDWLNVHYDDDPVFIYYSNTLVYEGAVIEGSVTRDEDNPMLYNKASAWHKVDAKSNVIVTIPFSMINLEEDVYYYVSVECYRLDLDYVCDIVRPDTCTTPHVDVDTYIEPYREVFKFSSYSDIVYNPVQTSGDVLPFDGSSGVSQLFSYNDNYDAVTDLKTGKQTIGHRDFLKDPDSWYNDGSYSVVTGGLVSPSGDFSITSFSGMFSQVFGAVKMFTNYLPSSIMSIFIFGFSSVVVIAIIKAVR